MTTATSNFTVVSPAAYLAAVADSPTYTKYREEEVARRERFRGAVVRVTEEVRSWSSYDDYRSWPVQLVTVWNAETNAAETLEVTGNESFRDSMTLWEVDADAGTICAYNAWVATVAAVASAHAEVKEVQDRRTAKTAKEVAEILNPPLRKGQVWEVAKGRKFPIGATGKVFWWDNGKWGLKVGLATTDRKDERGRNRDVIFVAFDNLRYVPTEEDKSEVARLNAECVLGFGAQFRLFEEAYRRAVEDASIPFTF